MTRLVVTGSRDWTDRAVVEEALRRLPVGRLAHGGARGLEPRGIAGVVRFLVEGP